MTARSYSRHRYHSSANDILNVTQNEKIQYIELQRKVVPEMYIRLMDLWTNGEVIRYLKTPIFHVSMRVTLSNGKSLQIEKGYVVHIKDIPSDEMYECKKIDVSEITFGHLLEKTRQEIGDKKFFSYSVKDNNCSHFIEFILNSNGLNTPEYQDFIEQNVKFLDNFHSLCTIINTVIAIVGMICFIKE